MSFWTKLLGASRKPTAQPTAAPAKPIEQPPKASRIYIFSSVVMNSQERQEALWGGFFTLHNAVPRSVAEHVQMAGAIAPVSPPWKSGVIKEANLEHAGKLGDEALDGLFDGEHKGGCYLDACLVYPDKPTVFVVMVWNAPVATIAMRLIPGAQIGKATSDQKKT